MPGSIYFFVAMRCILHICNCLHFKFTRIWQVKEEFQLDEIVRLFNVA